MYSKVKVAGHPLHPMLVAFPIACYVAACAAFVAYAAGAEAFWFRLAVFANVAGVASAAVAALPGFIDWTWGVPTGSPAKATGLVHMLFNICALLAFVINAFMQWQHRLETAPLVGLSVVLTGLGVVFTLVAGFFGWKMVQTHHVGIDLTPEQERLEPRADPRVARGQPNLSGHGPAR